MGAGALVIVDKSYSGEVWSNTYGIGLGAAPYNVEPADADMVAFGASGVFDDAATANAASPFATVLHAILNFERRMHYATVQFTRIYVTDGKRNFQGTPPAEVPNAFFTASLSFFGLVTAPAAGVALSGLVSLMVARNPTGFSKRRGRAFYRLVMDDTYVKAEASGLIDYTDAAVAALADSRVQTALTGSGLSNHFAGGSAVAGGVLLVPHYSRFVPAHGTTKATGGEMINGTPIASMHAIRPAGRQVKRGRKRPALG